MHAQKVVDLLVSGARPSNREDWTQSDSGQPLGGGRDLNTMARNVMQLIYINQLGGAHARLGTVVRPRTYVQGLLSRLPL